MDELELLKKDWQNKDEQLPKLSYNEIYKMILNIINKIKSSLVIFKIFRLILYPFFTHNSCYTDPSVRIAYISNT